MKLLNKQLRKLKNKYNKEIFLLLEETKATPWPIEPKYLKLENQEKEKDGDWEVLV